MEDSPVRSLHAAISQIPDPRHRRGVRHPATGMICLVLLGMICRLTEMAVLQRWAQRHWDVLREPLGFTRSKPPHATTLSRIVAQFPLAHFQQGLSAWVAGVVGSTSLVAAVDGKTSKQGQDADGDPVEMLNVFAQERKLCLGQWPLTDGKPTEPEVLKAHLHELFQRYPTLRALSGDALFAQRNLAELIVEAGRDYLMQIKANQPDLLEATQACFAAPTAPDAQTVEKKGPRSRPVGSGSISTARITYVKPCSSPA
jgi:DDE_Tnp_1-associated